MNTILDEGPCFSLNQRSNLVLSQCCEFSKRHFVATFEEMSLVMHSCFSFVVEKRQPKLSSWKAKLLEIKKVV